MGVYTAVLAELVGEKANLKLRSVILKFLNVGGYLELRILCNLKSSLTTNTAVSGKPEIENLNSKLYS